MISMYLWILPLEDPLRAGLVARLCRKRVTQERGTEKKDETRRTRSSWGEQQPGEGHRSTARQPSTPLTADSGAMAVADMRAVAVERSFDATRCSCYALCRRLRLRLVPAQGGVFAANGGCTKFSVQ